MWSTGAMFSLKSQKFETWDFKTETDSDDSQTIYDNIDLEKATARMIGGRGASNVHVLQGPAAYHFLEPTGSGMSITTIFGVAKQEQYFAIYSRHMMDGEIPLPSTYTGTCKIVISMRPSK
jgi:hypothetical protein